MERQFSSIAVTDAMVEVVCLATDLNEQAADGLVKRFLAAGGLDTVRVKGFYHSPSQLAALEAGLPPEDEARQVRMQCVSQIIGRASSDMTDGAIVAAADTLAQYVLTGKKPGAEG